MCKYHRKIVHLCTKCTILSGASGRTRTYNPSVNSTNGFMAYIGIRLSDKSKREIQSMAKDLDKTVSDITRELIETFIQEEKEHEHQ